MARSSKLIIDDEKKKKKSNETPVETSTKNYKNLREQKGMTKIQKMSEADNSEGSFSREGYELDYSKSEKAWTGTRWIYQPVYKKAKQTPNKPEGVTAKLPTKKVSTIEFERPSVTKLPKSKKPEAEESFKPEPKSKKLTKGGDSVMGSNIAKSVKNVVNKAKFEKEKKQAAAAGRALAGTGDRSPYTKERIETLKEEKKTLKEKGVRQDVGRQAQKSALKDVKAGLKYEKKVLQNRNVYGRKR